MTRLSRRHTLVVAVAAVLSLLGGFGIVAAISHPASRSTAVSRPVRALPETPSAKIAGYQDKGEDIHYCNGCTPPLLNSGGPVVDTSRAAGLTITPVFWEPSNATGANQIPASYQRIITGYINNVAAASGSTSNVYSIATEYYSTAGGGKTPITYKITAGTAIIDTTPLPPSGCTPNAANGYTSCITDLQLRAELTKDLTAQSLPSDLAHFYPVFFPPNTETQGAGGASGGNSDADYCGYHGAYVSGSGQTVYGNEPYETSGCDGGESPNGNLIADGAVGVLSHETSETMTDPDGSGILGGPAWGDTTGHEIGDECSGFYGPPLGSTDPSNPSTTAYNQVINGGKYYTQTEFSNTAFSSLGIGNGCQQSEAAATGTTPHDLTAATKAVGSVTNDAFPNTLAANGKAKSVLDIAVSDRAGYPIVGDRVNYSIYAITGRGYCGKINARSAKTSSGGHATVTYTASKSNVICAVVADEVDGGQGATGMIYQGTYQKQAVVATNDYPHALIVGGSRRQFFTDFKNPSPNAQNDARIQFGIFPGNKATDNIRASHVNLSYSTTGRHGKYVPVNLSGSTIVDGEIQGVVLPLGGVKIKADSTLRVYFHISLKSGISTKGGGAGIAIEAYLDQVDPASGALSTFADTLAYQVKVKPKN